MIEKLKAAHDELMQIHIQASDSVRVANALVAIEQVIQELEEQTNDRETESDS